MLRSPRTLLPGLLLLALLACSDDGDPAAPEPGPTTVASRMIPPTGGSLTVENEAGAQMTVRLPSGAVLEPTFITLRALDTPSGLRARFAILPAGLDLLAPATLTLKLPDGARIDETFGFSLESGERVPVPTVVDTGARTLTATLYHLGFDLNPPALAAATRETMTSDSGEFINVEDFECQFIRDSLMDAVLRAQAFVGAFPPDVASPLIEQYRAALLVCDLADSLAEATAIIQQIACSNANSAEAQAQVLLVENVQDFKTSLGSLLAAEGLVQLAGTDCHVENSVIESEFTEYINSYLARINDPGFTANFPTWDALWRELIPCTELRALADEFEIASASEKIEGELLPALFARLREVAADACEEDENNALLSDILSGGHLLNHPIAPTAQMPEFTGFSQSELLDQFHRCGSSLVFEARSPQGDLIDSVTIQGGGTSSSVTVIKDGRIAIEDGLLGLMCGQVLARDDVRVFAEIPGQLPTAPLGLLDGDKTVNVASTLAALPGDEPGDFDLVFVRDRSHCGIDNGGVPTIELYRLSVHVLGAAGSGIGTWSGGCTSGGVSGTYEMTIDNDGNVTGTYTGSASGTIEGTVTGSGTFNASAAGTAGPCSWSGTISGFGGNIVGSGGWTCDAGCSGSWTSGETN